MNDESISADDAIERAEDWLAEYERFNRALTMPGDTYAEASFVTIIRDLLAALKSEAP